MKASSYFFNDAGNFHGEFPHDYPQNLASKIKHFIIQQIVDRFDKFDKHTILMHDFTF